MNDIQEPHKLPAVLFPNAYSPESELKKILSFFGPLTIFEPWYMDRVVFPSQNDFSSQVRVLHPPVDLKPAEDFKFLLEDFRKWIEVNPDRGYRAFLSAGGMDQGSEDTTWAIRKALRQGRNQNGEVKLSPALKGHLVLYLAQQVEADRREAANLLGALREKDPPLKGTVEEEGAESLFYDLPGFGKELAMEERRLAQVYEAWFCLFGSLLEEHALLVTPNQQVMAHVSGTWQENLMGEEEISEMGVTFRIPDFSHLSFADFLEARVQAFNTPVMSRMREAIPAIWEYPKNRTMVVKECAQEIEKAFPEQPGSQNLWITVNYLMPGVSRKPKEAWGAFSGKTLILVSIDRPSY